MLSTLLPASFLLAAMSPLPQSAGQQWRENMVWETPRFLADNLVFLRPQRVQGPGVGEVGTVRSFSWHPQGLGSPAEVTLFLSGRRLKPVLVSRRVTPCAIREDFRIGDGVWHQKVCLYDDVVLLEGAVEEGPQVTVAVEGNLSGARVLGSDGGFLWGEFVEGEAVGMAFAFGSSLGQPAVAVDSKGLSYRAVAHSEGACNLGFAVAPSPEEAMARVRRFWGRWEEAASEVEIEWDRFFTVTMPPIAVPDPAWSRLLCWIGYCVKVNAFQLPGDLWPRTTGVWKGECTEIPLENRSLHAIGERWLTDSRLAVGDLRPFTRVSIEGAALVWTIAAAAVNRVWALGEVAGRILQRMEYAVHEFLRRYDLDGDFLPELDRNTTGLGWDNSARFDPLVEGTYQKGMAFKRRLVPVDTSVLLLLAATATAEMAATVGDEAGKRYMGGLAAQVEHAIQRHLWDEGAAVFSDLAGTERRPTGVATPASLFPLWAGIKTSRGGAMVRRLLVPSKLWPTYPVPTCALDESGFGRYWRGMVSLRINWVVLECLRRSGNAELGRELLRNMVRRYAENGYDCAEMYDPVHGCAGRWKHSPEVVLLLDQIVRGVVGLDPLGGGRWRFDPCFREDNWPYLRFGPIAYGADTLEIRWDEPGDGDDWFNDGTEGHWIMFNGAGTAAAPGDVFGG